jgi:hypothetical protein
MKTLTLGRAQSIVFTFDIKAFFARSTSGPLRRRRPSGRR